MKTYIFMEKNGSGNLALSADNEKEAFELLEEKVTTPGGWRLEDVED